MAESRVLHGILDLLKIMNIPHFRSNAGGGFRLGRGGKPQLISGAPKGWPDITGWLPRDGRILLIEVKAPGEKPTSGQLATLNSCNIDGGVGFWTDSINHCHATLIAIQTGLAVKIHDGESVNLFWRKSGE